MLLPALLLGFVCGGRAVAHPLGNFTINHLAKVGVGARKLHVRYILDIAERAEAARRFSALATNPQFDVFEADDAPTQLATLGKR
ncbi:MAG: hypothetical protein DLM50_05345 [Candidatus Meridianibacter frigidus]|nr:MAG: hypothetical protein DLM50_05345 [Candidatus Eremiobacteraeota bacterium]